MKVVLACYGMRGDIDPGVVVGRELLRRGHDVHIVVPPNLVAFAKSAGLSAVPCGLDSRVVAETQRQYWTCLSRTPWRFQERNRLGGEIQDQTTQCWQEITAVLTPLAEGADLLIAGPIFEQPVVNIAEYHDLALATLHFFPVRAHGRLLPYVPALLTRKAMAFNDWVTWRAMRDVDDAMRCGLGLPTATGPVSKRVTERGSLEIQAYDELCFPGLADEWASSGDRRPFVGALTMESSTEDYEGIVSWIAEGTPPIYFGFGSISVKSSTDLVGMIDSACAQLGERALIAAGGTDFSDVPLPDHIKVVGMMDYATIWPSCRAVVHHGGGGTTNTALRAGIPQAILWTLPDQPLWGAVARRLKVGTSRRFASTTTKTLVADLRRILDPAYRSRAAQIAARMTKASDSIAVASDLVEDFAGQRCGR